MTTENFELISIEETIQMIRGLKTDFAQTNEQAESFIKNNLGMVGNRLIKLLGIIKSSTEFYVITQEQEDYWIWLTHELSDNDSGSSEDGTLESFSKDYNLPYELLTEMKNRWN